MIQKPGKPKGPVDNLRPITLINIIRKIFSIIVLDRIRPKIEKYISETQCGFKKECSTAGAELTHKWLLAKIRKIIIHGSAFFLEYCRKLF